MEDIKISWIPELGQEEAKRRRKNEADYWQTQIQKEDEIRVLKENQKIELDKELNLKAEAFKKTDDFKQLNGIAKTCSNLLVKLITELNNFSKVSHQGHKKILRFVFAKETHSGRLFQTKTGTSITDYLTRNVRSIEEDIENYKLEVERIRKLKEVKQKRTNLLTKLNLSDEDKSLLGLK